MLQHARPGLKHSAFSLSEKQLPSSLSHTEVTTAMKQLTHLRDDEFSLLLVLLDPASSGRVSFQCLESFAANEWYIDDWFFIHSPRNHTLCSKRVMLLDRDGGKETEADRDTEEQAASVARDAERRRRVPPWQKRNGIPLAPIAEQGSGRVGGNLAGVQQ